MPYHIIKKIKVLSKGSSVLLPLFGIDLEDEKTWSYFKLHTLPPPKIHAKALKLFHIDGNERDVVNKTFEFETHTECNYIDGTNTKEKRLLYIPTELVQAYGIDENMAIELVVHEVIYDFHTGPRKVAMYESKMIEGPKDIEPKTNNEIDITKLTKENTKNKNQYNTFLELILRGMRTRVLHKGYNPAPEEAEGIAKFSFGFLDKLKEIT